MASHDARRVNPGIQVDLLYVGVATSADPYLVRSTSKVSNIGIKNSQILSGGASPSLVRAISPDETSGSLILLIPA